MTSQTAPEQVLPRIGDQLPCQEHTPTSIDLFRYSAVTWNSHRIHYDAEYARTEGYPDILVQSHLHGAYLCKVCTDWLGTNGRLLSLTTTVRRSASPGQLLRCDGRVVAVEPTAEGVTVSVELTETRVADGVVCAQGQAHALWTGAPVTRQQDLAAGGRQ